jgi:hypothetical protein
MKTFDEFDLLIISASKSFSGSQEEDQKVKRFHVSFKKFVDSEGQNCFEIL